MRSRTAAEAFQELGETSARPRIVEGIGALLIRGRRCDLPRVALRFPRPVHGIRTGTAPTDATTAREMLDVYRTPRSATTVRAGRGRRGRAVRRAHG